MTSTASLIWDSLNPDNKISLFVRYIDPATGNATSKIVNRFGKKQG